MKNPSKRMLLIVTLAALALCPASVFYFTNQDSNRDGSGQLQAASAENTVAPPKQEQASSGLPVRLKIPKIGVDSAVEHVGVTPRKEMDAPKDPANTAWFNQGPRPGDTGSAVITGHYGWKNGKTSVFDDLYKLRSGDKLYIEDDKGVIISFVVRESRSYDPKADASDVFGSNDGSAHLNLITCSGVWDKTQKSYSDRLVVFTDRG